MEERRPLGFWLLALVFAVFVLFLYGPTLTILVLSFQGPEGGLTFPMQGVSTHWYQTLWKGVGVVDINRLLKQFEMMQTMARQLSGKKMKRFQRGGGKMPFGF